MSTLWKFLLFIVSFFLSAWAAQNWLLHDWTMVWILMGSILLHEVGHFVLLLIYGLRPSMFFVPLLGAAVVAPDMKQKLNHEQLALVALAGPAVNLMLVAVGFAWQLSGSEYGIKLASLNSLLVWTNLVPLLILDGARFAKAIFASLNEDKDKLVAGLIGAAALVVGFFLLFSGKVSYAYLLIYFGIKLEAEKDSPSDAYSPQAMSEGTAMRLVWVYAAMMFGTMLASAWLPNWLK